jgi:tetratricopeptide (TPR) repeat protein
MGKVARNLRAESLFAHDAWASRGESVESESLGDVGTYRLLAAIGRGGLGVVYRAKAPDGRVVAVKVLRRLDSNDALLRFEREMKLLSLFGARDGFIPLLDRGESDRGPFLVMPLLEGGTLRDRLDAGPLGVEDAIALVRSIAQAVGRAHERGIVHRDLKPENVLFQEGNPLLADLGLAKYFGTQAGRDESLSRTGDLRGTLNYIAPEQARDAKSAGPRADVFSLGAILYECLAGRPAFEGNGALPIVQKMEKGEHEPLIKVRRDVPRWLAGAVERALAPDALERFQDGHAFARALVPATRPLRRVLGALLAVAACGAILAAALLSRSSRAREARRHVELMEAALGANDRNRAIAEATEAIDLDPELAPAWANRSLARCTEGDPDGALSDATKALAVDPRLALAWAAHSIARGYKGDYAGAVVEANKAIELAPALALGWAARGFARCSERSLDGALADLTRAIELDDKLALAWASRAAAWVEKRDWSRAIADSTRAIELDSRRYKAWAMRAAARSQTGNWDESIADSTRAIELKPGASVAWATRAVVRGAKGDREGEIADLTKAIELDPASASMWVERGVARDHVGDLDGSIADSTRAIELDPRFAEAWRNRGLAREKKKDWDGEIADLTRAIELDPRYTQAFRHRGDARGEKGDLEGAASDYERFLELAPDAADAPSIRGVLDELRKRIVR